MEKGFLCAKGRRGGSGVKEKQNSGFVDPVTNNDYVNEGIGSPSTINVNVESGSNISNGSVLITVHESPTTDSSVPIRSRPTSYAKLVTGEPSRKSVNFCILIAPMGNGCGYSIGIFELLVNGLLIQFMVSFWENSEDGLSIIATKLGTSLMLDSYTSDLCTQSWGRSSYDRAMIKLRADEELKDTIVMAMPKLIDVVKNLNNTRQPTRGVPVSPKVSFKSTKQIYRHVSNKNGASTSGKKKQAEVSRQEVFDEHVTFMASTSLKCGSDSGYGTNSLWEQWKEMKRDDDYDSYDDDLYASHDMSNKRQAICDEFYITVHVRKMK
ncbi:hypothetical protein Tco_0123372 [Tanacetum coccineum]